MNLDMKSDDKEQISFIVKKVDYDKKVVKKLAEKIKKFALISESGDLLLQDLNLLPDDKLRLLLSARFVAHKINKSIPETVKLSDAQKTLSNESLQAIGSRMSSLVKKDGFATKVERGIYLVQSYKIERFLNDLDVSQLSENDKLKGVVKKTKIARKRRTGKYSGVGKDIYALFESDFFQTPKTMKEIEEKLIEEIKFHDIRVIDSSVRKTFVKSQKLLKRIKNTGGGKAKWKYVKK